MLEMQRNLYVLRRWWWLLIVAAIVGGLLAYGLTKVLVKQQYGSTAVISVAPPPQTPNGLYLTMLAVSADSQLVPTLGTAQAARGLLPRPLAAQVNPTKLERAIQSTYSVDGQLLFVTVRWPDKSLVPRLTNTVAAAFIRLERTRLERRYRIIHSGLVSQEDHLASLVRQTASGSGPAKTWLESQFADSASKVYQQDADARIQASVQQVALQVSQPAVETVAVGPKATINGLLGGVLALLIALVFTFFATSSYGSPETAEGVRPVLTSIGE
jgi:capsular polysaccharide biosynthesis protein